MLLLLLGSAAARTVQPRGTGAQQKQQASQHASLFCSVGDARAQQALLDGVGRRRQQCTSVLSRLRGGGGDASDEKVEGDCASAPQLELPLQLPRSHA